MWSVTSWTELRREAIDVERWNTLHPDEPRQLPYVTRCLEGNAGVVVAASDYLKALPDSIAKWIPAPLISLGTDGFGRSATRAELRDHFEVDAEHIAFAALSALAREEAVEMAIVREAADPLRHRPRQAEPGVRVTSCTPRAVRIAPLVPSLSKGERLPALKPRISSVVPERLAR